MVRSSRYTTANTGASQVGSVAIGDFNGDGYPDLATTSAPDNSVYILLNKGTATPSFQAPVQYVQNDGTLTAGPYYLTIGDFNRDGNLDIISANNGNATVGVLLGTGTGTFGAATYYPVGSGAIFANAGDINGDDRVDITAVTSNGLSVLLSGQSESASISNVAFYGCSTQSVTATYGGDGNYGSSTSAASTFTPAKDNNRPGAHASRRRMVLSGQQVTLQATLSPYSLRYDHDQRRNSHLYEQWRRPSARRRSPAVSQVLYHYRLTAPTASRQPMPGDCSFSASTSNTVTGTTLLASTLTWATPAPITYGTPLSGTQLNATDNQSRNLRLYSGRRHGSYRRNKYSLRNLYSDQPDYTAVETATVQLTVTQDPTVITWPTPTPITYGTPLSGFQLDATASSGIRLGSALQLLQRLRYLYAWLHVQHRRLR